MKPDVNAMDPFTTIYRGRGGGYHSKTGRVNYPFHLDPNCPAANPHPGKLNPSLLKGRLGAMLAHGRPLCHYEATNGGRFQ